MPWVNRPALGEARFGPRGKRDYILVLRLHEDLPPSHHDSDAGEAEPGRGQGGETRRLAHPHHAMAAAAKGAVT